MAVKHLEYPLQNGFIHNWLVAGPFEHPVSAHGTEHALQDPTPGYTGQPVDWQSFAYQGEELTWRYFRCAGDHLVDLSCSSPVLQNLRAWAYARLSLGQPLEVGFALSVRGPAEVWLNGERIFQVGCCPDSLKPVVFRATLQAENELFVQFDQECAGECSMPMALRLADFPTGFSSEHVTVRIPTSARYPQRQKQFEELFEKAYLEEAANYRGNVVNLRWAEDTHEELHYAYQIQDAQERIYTEGTWDPDPKQGLDIGHPQRIFERPMWVVLRAPGKEYFEQGMRYERRMPVYVMDNAYSELPYGSPASRRAEALEDAARRDGQVFAEIAKMALGRWDSLNAAVIQAAIERVNRREVGSAVDLAGLLSILYRNSGAPEFPAGLKEPLEACLLTYPYTVEETGPQGSAENYTAESQVILLQACRLLAGQRFPGQVFSASGASGQDLQAASEAQALDWLRKRGRGGFMEWDSPAAIERNILSLSLLTSLAQSEPVRELSAVLLDKILFLMALNSFYGAYGTTHGAAHASMLKSAKLEATSAVSRLLFGMGVYSRHLLGTVSLACSEYEYPTFFADLAARQPEELWSRERHAADPGVPGAPEVNKVTYRTPDYMLSSAQDYRPGQPGSREHVWQATLGPDALVFANHPANMGDDDAHAPGFWLGNATLPRLAQWKDVLIAVYHLPEEDWMGFTHAYFPVHAFDETSLEGGWAFARKGQGYLAITASQGFELVKRGPDGYRELRSPGHETIWLVQMGREHVDGSFSDFIRKVLALAPEWKDGSVQFTNLRGERLAFGWQGPLQVNGRVEAITGFPHIENPFCTASLPADHLDIRYDDYLLRLDFE